MNNKSLDKGSGIYATVVVGLITAMVIVSEKLKKLRRWSSGS